MKMTEQLLEQIIHDKPLLLGEALKYFFTNAEINLYNQEAPINLLDLFPTLKNGYTLGKTVRQLFILYNIFNQIGDGGGNYVLPDSLYEESFNSDILATYYWNRMSETKILMVDAIKQGLSEGDNTFQIMSDNHQDFNTNRINFGRLKQILNLNLIVLNDKSDRDLMDHLVDELIIADEILQVYGLLANKKNDNYIDVYDFINVAILNKKMDLVNLLLQYEDVSKLYVSILLGDILLVNEYLKTKDPRERNHEAYKLAIEHNKTEIADVIMDNIVQRTLNERLAIKSIVEQLGVKKTNLPTELYEQINSNLRSI